MSRTKFRLSRINKRLNKTYRREPISNNYLSKISKCLNKNYECYREINKRLSKSLKRLNQTNGLLHQFSFAPDLPTLASSLLAVSELCC